MPKTTKVYNNQTSMIVVENFVTKDKDPEVSSEKTKQPTVGVKPAK